MSFIHIPSTVLRTDRDESTSEHGIVTTTTTYNGVVHRRDLNTILKAPGTRIYLFVPGFGNVRVSRGAWDEAKSDTRHDNRRYKVHVKVTTTVLDGTNYTTPQYVTHIKVLP